MIKKENVPLIKTEEVNSKHTTTKVLQTNNKNTDTLRSATKQVKLSKFKVIKFIHPKKSNAYLGKSSTMKHAEKL